MKKRLLILGVIMTLTLTACGGSKTEAKPVGGFSGSTESNSEEAKPKDKKESKNKKENKKTPVTIDQLKTDVTLEEPDSLGNIYGNMTVTNNSEYPLVNFTATAIRKSNNEKTYFSTYDTVMPGETSAQFDTMIGDNSGSDYEIINYKYTVKTDDKKIVIDYDVKLDDYKTLKLSE